MKKPFFYIIVVSYNAGDKLFKTIESVLSQSFDDYRILIKDGLSTDGSIERLKKEYDIDIAGPDSDLSRNDKKITLVEGCDNGIYHAMNIAISFLERKYKDLCNVLEGSSYAFFLNCGDYFYDENVLATVHKSIIEKNSREGTTLPAIFYGDIFDSATNFRVSSNPKIDDYACYRHVPWHQACFYDERLIYKNPFDLKYQVRADYEQFLRCFYREKANTYYISVVISKYEGGGFSDKNKAISESERKEIIKMYLEPSKIRKYDFLRVVTLTRFRTFLASNKVTAGFYNWIRGVIYSRR